MSKVYEIVTQKIIEKLEKGVVPWRQPWKGTKINLTYYDEKDKKRTAILYNGLISKKNYIPKNNE